MFRVSSDDVVTRNSNSFRRTRYPVPRVCNILLLNRPIVAGELVLRVSERMSWRYWSYVRGNDYWGYFRTQWNIQNKRPEERSRCGDLSPHYPCKSVICKFNFRGLHVVTFYSSWAEVERVGTAVTIVTRTCNRLLGNSFWLYFSEPVSKLLDHFLSYSYWFIIRHCVTERRLISSVYWTLLN